ncbi:hypothetical protein [Acaricomes phytoseiuli]|uniref:hypothetical protein n=1 Tax=Acaricomes phytoseiuli TaxID=291968 RepID=UPI00036F6F51|nr:hypothetical protein [Acaricomes phytoseiuli]
MRLFSRFRAERRLEEELGKGVWRRVHDRFRRGLDRFHQILEGIDDPALHEAAVPLADQLAEGLPRVHRLCRRAQKIAPSENFELPQGDLNALHRELSQAANALATAAEALAMARFGEADMPAVRRRVARVEEHLSAAEQLPGL